MMFDKSYDYDKRMDELQKIYLLSDKAKRILALKQFIAAEEQLLPQLKRSQALTTAQIRLKEEEAPDEEEPAAGINCRIF